MLLKYDEHHLNISFEELDAFFSYPRAEPCYAKIDELLTSKNKGAVIKLRLEDFKSFNETFGYQFGELFLKTIARFLCGIQGADVYRPSGVEFILIFDKRYTGQVNDVLEKIKARFEAVWHIHNLDCMCSINLAATFMPGHADTTAEMVEHLNYALGEAANRGPNNYCLFDEKMRFSLYKRQALARFIPQAIEKGLLEMRYRPTYNVITGKFSRADSYMRLISPDFGIVHASEFVPIAEETGQIYLISTYAVHKACELITRLIEQEIEFEKIAIPISPAQFLQERFMGDIKEAMSHYNIPPDRLAFEVSENVTLRGFASAHDRVGEIAEMGVEIIFTEFGFGYASAANVIGLPVAAVKLDRMLTWQIDNDTKGPLLAEGLIHIAKNLGLKVIAEGVETQNQVDVLKEYKCDYQQGFYYAPTLNANELIESLKKMG